MEQTISMTQNLNKEIKISLKAQKFYIEFGLMDNEQLKSNIGRALNSFLFTILYEPKSLDGTKYTHV